ncbi:retrovirus-related pol polyprotein from transposon TNT 1-94 [Tanacetum coccineum]
MKVKESLNMTFDECPPPPKTSPLEDDDLVEEEVIKLVPQPKFLTIIGTKWAFRNKVDENGIMSRNKARLVAQGYNQQEVGRIHGRKDNISEAGHENEGATCYGHKKYENIRNLVEILFAKNENDFNILGWTKKLVGRFGSHLDS